MSIDNVDAIASEPSVQPPAEQSSNGLPNIPSEIRAEQRSLLGRFRSSLTRRGSGDSNDLSASRENSLSPQAVEQQRETLLGNYFRQIGQTEFFISPMGLAVRLNKQGVQVYSGFGTLTPKGIDAGLTANDIRILGEDFKTVYDPLNGKRNDSGIEYRAIAQRIKGKSISDQLQGAGFQKTERDIFSRTFHTDSIAHEVVAVMSGKEIGALAARINLRELGPNVTIIGVEAVAQQKRDGPDRLLRVKSDNGEFYIGLTGKIVKVGADKEKINYPEPKKPVDITVEAFEPITQPDGFVIGGENETDKIRQLSAVNGVSISKLESDMRPHMSSGAGFLGSDESLVDILAEDNDFVTSHGLTHQDIGLQMRYVHEYIRTNRLAGKGSIIVPLRDRNYQVDVNAFRGYQYSPFNDGTSGSWDITIVNPVNGNKITYSTLLGPMIERYGFYEGKGTPYRVSPEGIIETFDFLKEDGQKKLVEKELKSMAQ